MRTSLFSALLGLVAGLLLASSALAQSSQVPTLTQVEAAGHYVSGVEACDRLRATERPACMASLGAPQAVWDRDRDGRYVRRDVELATTEYWDGGRLEFVCYDARGGARFAEECDRSKCLEAHTNVADCDDKDGDGLFAYQEAALGTSDSVDNTCISNADCGFTQDCRHPPAGTDSYARALCLPRAACASGSCVAFSLTQVAQDDRELIVHVNYEYSPEQARVLDLKIQVPNANLALTDARLLAGPKNANKELATRTEIDRGATETKTYVRLTVYGTSSLEPIPYGPIVELVFAKTGRVTGSVGFSADPNDRASALAPNPEAARTELKGNLWGAGIPLGSANKLLVQYSFDNPKLVAPGAMPEASYCNGLECVGKEKRKASDARGGYLDASSTEEAVSVQAARFGGAGQHAALPVLPLADTSTAQSWSGWINPDERRSTETAEQLLFGHTSTNGVFRYGLMLKPQGTDKWSLVLRQQAATATDAVDTEIVADLPTRTWTHVAMNLSSASPTATTGMAQVFTHDGNSLKSVDVPLQMGIAQCPAAANPPLVLENPGERVLYATAENQLFAIHRADAFGTSGSDLLRDNKASIFDPDYDPTLDKIVYVSTQSGSHEIWLADADGKNATQVTQGFGDVSRGIFARRPRFSPVDPSDSTTKLIVFESNVFDAARGDNPRKVYRLFALKLVNGAVKAPVGGGQPPSSQLVYGNLLRNQVLSDAWISDGTNAIPTANLSNVRWLSFSRLMLTQASEDLRDKVVVTTTLAKLGERYQRDQLVPVDPIGSGAAKTVELLDARSPAGGNTAVALTRRNAITYESSSSVYRLETRDRPGGGVEALVYYDPSSVDPYCWDQNFNYRWDKDLEDFDKSGDQSAGDCGLMEATDLALTYGSLSPAKTSDNVYDVVPNAALLADPYKRTIDVRFRDAGLGTNVAEIQVLSPRGGQPVPKGASGTLLATVRFNGSDRAQVHLRVRKQTSVLERWTQIGTNPWTGTEVHVANVTDVLGGALSPDGTAALVSVAQQARPMLMKVSGIATATASAVRLDHSPERIEGLDWEKYEAYRPCHWLAAHRDRIDGKMLASYRGLLDEVKVYNYLRSREAILSDAERGREWLTKRNPSGSLPPGRACESDTDCAPYQLCNSNKLCDYDYCGESDPGDRACSRGQCTLIPASLAGNEAKWACSVECNTGDDTACFSRECYNGPCRFCEANSCIECRWDPAKQIATGVVVATLEGCPDGNSFACNEGSCVSECYAFENGESRYLCTTNEYCQRGRCVPLRWDWPDFAPATFASAAQSFYDNPNLYPYTSSVVANTVHSLYVRAYGTSDLGRPPEVRVQATSAQSPFGPDTWFDLGTISIDNQVQAEAEANPYVLQSQYPLTRLRFTMVAPPVANPTNGARGYLDAAQGSLQPMCSEPGIQCGQLPGTRRRLGYPFALRGDDVRQTYEASGGPEGYRFLLTGEPTVIIHSLTLNPAGAEAPANVDLTRATNNACQYRTAGTQLPQANDLINFGALYTRPASGYGVLNGPEVTVGSLTSELRVTVLPDTQPKQFVAATETAAGCYYGSPLPQDSTANRELCFSYGGGPLFDPYGSRPLVYGSLEIGNFTSFGY